MLNSNQELSSHQIDPTAILTLSKLEMKLVRWISRNPANDAQAIAEAVTLSIEETRRLLQGLIQQGFISEQVACRGTSYRLMIRQRRKPRKRSKTAEELWNRL